MSKTRMISVTIPEKVLVKIERDAKEMNRSRSNQVATILSKYYEKEDLILKEENFVNKIDWQKEIKK